MNIIATVNENFGDMDLSLLDLLLKGLVPDGKVLDVGFGDGRNLYYFIRNGYSVAGIDQSTQNVDLLKFFMDQLSFNSENILEGTALSLPFDEASFDFVICSRVFHLLPDLSACNVAFREISRVLRPGGLLYFVANTNVGMEDLVEYTGSDRYTYSDGKSELLITEEIIDSLISIGNFDRVGERRFIRHGNIRCEMVLAIMKIS